MADIVEKLRHHRLSVDLEAGIAIDEAADEITRLRARLAEKDKALEPFARAATAYLIEELDDDYRPDWSPFIPYGAYRRAREAWGGEDV